MKKKKKKKKNSAFLRERARAINVQFKKRASERGADEQFASYASTSATSLCEIPTRYETKRQFRIAHARCDHATA
jgi:hypothetical protein